MVKQLDALYAQRMAAHPYGHALYEPVSAKLLRPGVCGYLSAAGSGSGWTPLFDLNSQQELEEKGFSVLENLEFAPSESFVWGPKVSSKVDQLDLDFKAEFSGAMTGAPVDVGGLFGYHSQTDFGAVLITTAPVEKSRIYHTAHFKKWARENALKILAKWPDVKDRGFFIVTSTYAADNAMVESWNSPGIGFKVGGKVGLTAVGELAPAVNWYRKSHESGWSQFLAQDSGDKKVVFFGGLYFRFRPLKIENHAIGEVKPSKWAKHRGRPQEISFEDGDFEIDLILCGPDPNDGEVEEDEVEEVD